MTDSSPRSVELQDLLQQANQGSDEAFQQLVFHATDRLRGLARGMLRRYPHVRRWEETDDVLQTVLLRLHRALTQVRPESLRGFYGLAATQTRRLLIDLARHYYGAQGLGTKHQTAGGGGAADDAGGVIEQFSGQQMPESLEDWTAFHQAIGQLPDEQREVFELSWYSGLPQREIAEMLGVTPRTVIRRLHRARAALHQQLSGGADADA